MSNKFYYAVPPTAVPDLWEGSRATDAAPLVVNCAGCFETSVPFVTDNPTGREDYYLMLLLNGRLTVRMPEGEREASVGTLLLFPAHYPYRYAFGGGQELCYLWVHFSGSHVEHYLNAFFLSPTPLLRSGVGESRAVSVFERIFDDFSTGGPLRDAALACHLERLLLTLATDASSRPSLFRSLTYIDEHYTEALSVTTLAALENLSYSRYHDRFTAELGMPPRRYITRKRLELARELLLNTDMSVGQIGAHVGYDDPHFFSKSFKKEAGLSPLEFRRAGKAK